MTHPAITARRDQLQAAAEEQERDLRDWATADGLEFGKVMPSPVLDAKLNQLFDKVQRGEIDVCPHLTSPQPAYTALWGNKLLCVLCSPQLERPIGDADRTCDLCGDVVELIHPDVVRCGPVAVFFGACGACQSAMQLEERRA